MREHWRACITHFDEMVDDFISDYFRDESRRCVLLAGAGFDPRSRRIAEKLHATLGARLRAILVREERADPAEQLRAAADDNEARLSALIAETSVESVRIFSSEDGAPVGGQRIVEALEAYQWPDDITDIVLDFSALSTGIGFPMARYVLNMCEAREGLNFHIMISSNPELDASIVGEPYDSPSFVRGFSGDFTATDDAPLALIWLPQLASGRLTTLQRIRSAQGDAIYKVCPILPFPARNPRRADDLITEFSPLLSDEGVDARDFLYVSERNPLDSYRKLSTLKKRYDETVGGSFTPQLLLSPIGSKVMAVGAMMAAIEHGLPVQHVENLRYDFDPTRGAGTSAPPDLTVHLWLHGPIYSGYAPPQPNDSPPTP